MSIQDFFSCVYHSHRQRLDRLATLMVIDVIKDNVISGKELEAGQLIEKGRNDLAGVEAEFLNNRSGLFLNFGIDVGKFIDNINPVDEAINQLQKYATRKGFIYEQICLLAEYFGLFVQIKSQIQQDVVNGNGMKSAELLLINRIQSLLPVLAGENATELINEFSAIASNPNKYTLRQYEFFVDKVCSSLNHKENLGVTQKAETGQIHITGDITGSTIIVGNSNEVRSAFEIRKSDFEDLVSQLIRELQKAPHEKVQDAEVVAEYAKELADEVSKKAPRKVKINISKEGLIKAAENIASTLPTVLQIAKQIVNHKVLSS